MDTLEILTETKNIIYPQMARRCDNIVNGIKDKVHDLKMSCTLNAISSMYQLFFTSEKVRDDSSARKSNTTMYKILYDELLKAGVFVPPSQFETCFLSYAHTEDDCDN